MTVIKLRYVDSFCDRHGRRRYYFRRARGVRVALPGKPGSPEFMTAYQKALSAHCEKKSIPRTRGEPGTFDRLAKDYFQAPEFLRLAAPSKESYRYVIERWIREENIGRRLVAEITRDHVSGMVAKRVSTPGVAHQTLQKIKILMHFAIDRGWRTDDPTVRLKAYGLGTIHTWTDEEIKAYEQAWPVGTLERTAFALFLYTGQRVADVASMAWGDVEKAGIRVTQSKTKAKLTIPLHPELTMVLQATPKKHVTILTNNRGAAFSRNGLGDWMAKSIACADLPSRCVPHGLRKAAALLLAEAGCSVKEIQAITGHASLAEIERYTRAASQKLLAAAAVARLAKHGRNGNSQT